MTAPPERQFFYGWIMLAVAILMATATMPGQTVLIALYNESVRTDLGLSIQQLSFAYSLATIIASLPLPLVGRVADRIGLRTTVAAISIGFIASLILLREATGVVGLGACFFLVRFLGQGSLGMLCGHTIAMWFERRLGLAHSFLAVLGFGAASAILPQPVAWLISEYGWQTALLVSAVGVAVLTLPPLLIFRNRPEDVGQHLDGDRTEHEAHDVMHGGRPPANDPAFTVRQAMETRAYWILAANMLTTGLIGTALLFHMQTMLHHAGLEGTERQTAFAIQPWPIAFSIGVLIIGPLADRFHAAALLPWALVLKLVAVLTCLAATRGMVEPDLVIPVMATGMGLYGVGQATVFGVGNPTIARYFGRTHHGAIRGTISRLVVMGTGGGPYLVAVGFDLAGDDFTPIYLLLAAWLIPLGIATTLLRKPTPPAERDLTPEPDEPDPPGAAL